MAYWSLAEVKSKVDKDLDLENETIVQDSEFVSYVNDAIRDVAAEISKLGVEDLYYHTKELFPVTQNVAEYNLPTDIFKNKIVEFVYDDGTEIRRIKRLRGRDLYTKMQALEKYPTSTRAYFYAIFNYKPSIGDKLRLIPTPVSSSATNFTMYYIRQAEELALDDDGTGLVDCPEEFIQFLLAFVKVKCLLKEPGHPLTQIAMADEDRCRKLMVQTLTDQVQDSDNTIPLDLSHYEEST
jgi:hypothetical protein